MWVFHAGALGDFVMVWPPLRALRRAGAEVAVVAAASKARLAERELGVRGVGGERAEVAALWGEPGGAAIESAWRGLRGSGPVGMVVSFVADEGTDVGRRWCGNAARALGCGRVVCVGAPGSASRAAVWEGAEVARLGGVGCAENTSGPVVVHVGAGGEGKRWPMDRWAELVRVLRAGGRSVRVIGGEVEAERLAPGERRVFDGMGGEMVRELGALADIARGAEVFVGCDTGPTHLAAQLGVRTVALFGPTDPAVWAPVGPAVAVVAPKSPRAIVWLGVETVMRAVSAAIGAVV